MPTSHEEWPIETRRFGRRVLVFDELTSTNDEASRSVEPVAILARHQTSGRGRFGRVWRSRPGSALLMSVAFHPPAHLRRPSVLTAWAAVAVADVIERLAGLHARIKWPNDLLVNGQKVCGILIEQGAATVVGIGLNLSQTREEFDNAGLPRAASLASITGIEIDYRAAAECVLKSLDDRIEQLMSDRELVEAAWRDRTELLGREVLVDRSDGSRLSGCLLRLGFDELELEQADGERRTFLPESVEHITPGATR